MNYDIVGTGFPVASQDKVMLSPSGFAQAKGCRRIEMHQWLSRSWQKILFRPIEVKDREYISFLQSLRFL